MEDEHDEEVVLLFEMPSSGTVEAFEVELFPLDMG